LERFNFDYPTCKAIKEILVTYFPPKNKLITYTVINTLARDELKKRRGINSVVIAKFVSDIVDTKRKMKNNKELC